MNPIELLWSFVKRSVRAVAHRTDAYVAALAADTDGTVVTIAFNRAAPQVA